MSRSKERLDFIINTFIVIGIILIKFFIIIVVFLIIVIVNKIIELELLIKSINNLDNKY